MACRFRDTAIWEEDWYIDLGCEMQHFWDYITDNCNHAGIWKPNKSGFEMRTRTKVNLDSFFQKVNGDKERILKLKDGEWFLTGFIKFQWFNKKDGFDLVLSNRLHLSIFKEIKKFNIPLQKVRGLQEVLETSKDMDKDKGMDKDKIEYGVKNGFHVSIKKKYLNDKIKVIHNLSEYFTATNQLMALTEAKLVKFDEFMKANPGRVFDDEDHLYNAYRKFCTETQKVSKSVIEERKQKARSL
jgi:hypothetical protein